MLIRQAAEDDIQEIGHLFSKVYTTEAFNKFTPDRSVVYMRWLLSRCPEVAFVAIDDDKIIGAHLAGTKPWFDGLRLVDGEIFVDVNYRNMGVGLALTERWLEAAKRLGVTVVEAVTTIQCIGMDIPAQFTNLDWHKKNGFYVAPHMAIIQGRIDNLIEKNKEHLRASSEREGSAPL